MVITARTDTPPVHPSTARAALRDITDAQDELDSLAEGLTKRMADLHAMQDTFETAVNRQAKSLRAITPARITAAATTEPGESVEGLMSEEDWTELVAGLRERLREMQLLMPAAGGMFVELFLGSINVRFARKSERIAFKKEYEKLKQKLAPVFVFFCVLCLIFEEYRWLHMILQLSLSCYYVTLAVRENILRANGSNIRAWWIIHHYFTMMQGVLLLTWPNGISYAMFRKRLHLFGLYNAILMIFQTRYQMARLYTLRSLGMANEMDVASSDSPHIHWSETMHLLLPLIVFGQMMQGYQAVALMGIYRKFPSELQVLLLSILFFANFIGNSVTTVQVLLAKRAANKSKSADRGLAFARHFIAEPHATVPDAVEPLTREEEKKTT